jgi:hypothetical protein
MVLTNDRTRNRPHCHDSDRRCKEAKAEVGEDRIRMSSLPHSPGAEKEKRKRKRRHDSELSEY